MYTAIIVGGVLLAIYLCGLAANSQHPDDCACSRCDDSSPWDDLGEGLL